MPLRQFIDRNRSWLPDALALLALLVGAYLALGFLIRDDVFIYGDNPGHYWLTWFTLNIAIPQQGQLGAWMPGWYAGYPELQFYPPGFILFAWLLRTLSFGAISVPLAYELVLFSSYTLPGITFYYALRHMRFTVLTAFAGGVFGLIFPAIFGGAIAPIIGLIGTRLAWAMNPLVLVWLIDVLERRGRRYWFLATLALAIAILFHPYHEVGIILGAVVYLLIARQNILTAGLRLASVIAAAALLDAFWLLPVLAYSSAQMVPILRATFDQTRRHLFETELLPYAVLALFSIRRIPRASDRSQQTFVITLLLMIPLLAGIMLAAHVFLIDSLGIYQLDPVRLIGEYYLALALLAAIGLGEVAALVGALFAKNPTVRRASMAAVVLVICALLTPSLLQLRESHLPRENDEPRFLSAAIQEYKFDEFWQVLKETPGRVWFTSYYQQLNNHETEPLPTTLTALTPLYAEREIIGGTYSRWSPIAALMWVGETHPDALRGLVEDTDDVSLFGIPVEELTPEKISDLARRFNVTTIVASADDFQTRTLLDSSPQFQSYYNNGLLFAYRALDYASTWVEGTNATIEDITYNGNNITFRVRDAAPGARAHVKVYAAPLWRATTDAGVPLEIREDDMGLLELALPEGSDYNVTVRYEQGTATRAGVIASGIAWVAFLGAAAFLLYRKRSSARH